MDEAFVMTEAKEKKLKRKSKDDVLPKPNSLSPLLPSEEPASALSTSRSNERYAGFRSTKPSPMAVSSLLLQWSSSSCTIRVHGGSTRASPSPGTWEAQGSPSTRCSTSCTEKRGPSRADKETAAKASSGLAGGAAGFKFDESPFEGASLAPMGAFAASWSPTGAWEGSVSTSTCCCLCCMQWHAKGPRLGRFSFP